MADPKPIVYRFLGNTAQLEKALFSARRALRDHLKAYLAVGAAVVASAEAYRRIANEIAGVIDEVGTLATITGLSAETIGGLRVAAQLTNKDLAALVPKELGKRISDFEMGTGEAKIALEDLGFQARSETTGELKSLDATLAELLTRIGAVENPAKAAEYAIRIFGAEAAQLIDAFGDGEALQQFVDLAGDFGADTGPAAAKQAAAWHQATAALGIAIEGAKSELFLMFSDDASAAILETAANVGYVAEAFVSVGRLAYLNTGAIRALWRTAGGELDAFINVWEEQGATWDDVERRMAAASARSAEFKAALADLTKEKTDQELADEEALRAAIERQTAEAEAERARLRNAAANAKRAAAEAKAASEKARTIESIAKIEEDAADRAALLQKARLEDLSTEEAAHARVIQTIEKKRASLIELGETGEDTASALVALNAWENEQIAAADAAAWARQEAALHKQIDANVEAAEAEVEEITAARAQMIDAWVTGTLDGLSLIATAQMDKHRDEIAALDERIEAERGMMEAARGRGRADTQASRDRIVRLKEERAAHEAAIRRAFWVDRAAALASIFTQAAIAFVRFLAEGGIIGGPVAAAAILTPGVALSVAQVLAQKPPAHAGAVDVDEGLTLTRSGEAVVSERGVRRLGRSTIDAANRGTDAGGAQQIQIVFRDRVLDQMMTAVFEGGGGAANFVTAGRASVGMRNPYGGK